jgi:hypothetical protein
MYDAKNRIRKRTKQWELTQRLSHIGQEIGAEFNKGFILALSGPKPTKAIKWYQKYNLGYRYFLFEKDKDIYTEASFDLLWKDTKKIKLLNKDIFIGCRLFGFHTTGIDFDFCTTMTPEIAEEVIQSIKYLELQYVWFRVTTCHRKVKGEVLLSLEEKIKEEIACFTDYSVVDEVRTNYRDTATMHVWQCILQRKEKNMRTLKQMTKKEQDMARALVNGMTDNYTDQDISKLLRLKPTSVRALRAHVTMRELGH